jgi:uncharacterized protein (DUF1499 family)
MMRHTPSRLGSALLVIAILAAVAIGLMMFGARFGFWEPIVGFGLVRNYMNLIGYGVVGIGVAGLFYQLSEGNRGGSIKAGIATLIGMAILAPMMYAKIAPPVRLPPIHDITTDTSNPPRFITLDDQRAGAKNSLIYGGPEIAAQQLKAYPDIRPVQSSQSALQAFAKALSIGKNMGWEIVDQNPTALRFEASARTSVYRFVDDIVVVVTPTQSGSRIDIRSVSRIGRGDRGVNAARIQAFNQAFSQP